MRRNPVILSPHDDTQQSALLAVQVNPFQQTFCSKTSEIVANLGQGQSLHVIQKQKQLVGCFIVDTHFHFTHTFANSTTPGVVNFMIDQDRQGEGLGTEACRMLPTYLGNLVPLSRGLYSLVHVKNVGGYKSFTRGGWSDTGEQYKLAPTGPQHIMWMPFQ